MLAGERIRRGGRRPPAALLLVLTSVMGLGLATAGPAPGSDPAPSVTPSPASSSTRAPGSVDTSFGQGGSVAVAVGSGAGAAAVAVQANGDIVTAGEALLDGEDVILSTRMTPGGELDQSYGTGGIVTVPINGSAGVDSGSALALAPDGKIVIVGGAAPSPGAQLQFTAVRLATDGKLDPTFGQDGVAIVAIGTTSIATAVVVEPDGKIAMAGVATVGHRVFAAARLNPDGTPDAGFGDGGATTFGPPGAAWAMAFQPDGRLVLAGQTATATGSQAFMAARLNSDGTLDLGFGQAGTVAVPLGSRAYGFGLGIRPDGRIVLAGPALTDALVAATVLLNSDGSIDRGYGNSGIATAPYPHGVNGMTLDQQGRMVLPTVGAGALRLSADGSADSTFGAGGGTLVPIGTGGGANGVAIQAGDGKIVLAGLAGVNGQSELTVIRLNGGGPVAGSTVAAAATPRMIVGPGYRAAAPDNVVKAPKHLRMPRRTRSRCAHAGARHGHRRLSARGGPHRHRAPRCRRR
jgi:uncharacterized delta-60 repeat protein